MWPDLAKGACVILVVLWHVISKSYGDLSGGAPHLDGWFATAIVLAPIRIPLFFAVSGYFAGRALSRPWREVLRPRITNFSYLYALWLVIHTAVFSVLDLRTNAAHSPAELALYLLSGASNLWYLYALVAYFLVARAARRRVGPALLLATALAVAAHAHVFPAFGNSDGLLRNLVFFLLSAYAPQLVDRIVAAASWRLLVGASCALAVVTVLAPLSSVLAVPASAGGVWVGITAAVLASRWPATGWLVAVGRRTLPVYVMHLPFLAALHTVIAPLDTRSAGTWMTLYPLAATALVVVCSLATHRALRAAHLGLLFALPPAPVPPVR